jgi:hypothetical protein
MPGIEMGLLGAANRYSMKRFADSPRWLHGFSWRLREPTAKECLGSRPHPVLRSDTSGDGHDGTVCQALSPELPAGCSVQSGQPLHSALHGPRAGMRMVELPQELPAGLDLGLIRHRQQLRGGLLHQPLQSILREGRVQNELARGLERPFPISRQGIDRHSDRFQSTESRDRHTETLGLFSDLLPGSLTAAFGQHSARDRCLSGNLLDARTTWKTHLHRHGLRVTQGAHPDLHRPGLGAQSSDPSASDHPTTLWESGRKYRSATLSISVKEQFCSSSR